MTSEYGYIKLLGHRTAVPAELLAPLFSFTTGENLVLCGSN